MDYKTIIVWGAIALIFLGVIWVFRRRSKKKRMQSEGGYGTPMNSSMNYRYGEAPRNAQPQNYREEPRDEIRELRQEIRSRHKDLTQLFKDFDYLLVSLQQRQNQNRTDRENVVFPEDEPRDEPRKRGRPKKLNDYR